MWIARFFLLVLILVVVPSHHKQVGVDNYVFLIMEVHNYYGTSCIFLIQPGSFDGEFKLDPDVNTTTLMHTWSREFSRQGVLTLTLTFPELLTTEGRYHRRIVRPLFVVLLTRRESFEEFATVTGKEDIAYPVWFVIFMSYPGEPLRKDCREPSWNVFNVNFNTEMLVLCYDNPMLREWYALNDNRTRTLNLAFWHETKGLILLTKKSLYARRSNLFGETLRIATVKESAFMEVKDNVLTGLLGGLLIELSKVMNFKLKLITSTESYGSWNEEEHRWTGAIGQLMTGKADIGVADFTVTTHRLNVIDFTLPLILSRNRFYIKVPDGTTVQWSGYFKAFHAHTWSAILALILTAPILLTIIKTKGSIANKVIFDNYIHVWGIFCQQGLSEFPADSSLRLAFLSIFVSALIVSAAYSASLISFLTVTTASLPFSTIEGLAKDGSYKLIVFRNSADYDMFAAAKDSVLTKLMTLITDEESLPLNSTDGFEQVCAAKVAFYTTEAIKTAMVSHIPCTIVFIESGRTDSLALGLPKDSPYTGVINHHLQRFHDNGVLSRLKALYMTKPHLREKVHQAVGLWGIAPLLAVLAGGIFLGLIALSLEKAYSRNKCKGKTVDNPKKLVELSNLTKASNKNSRNVRVDTKALSLRDTYKIQWKKQRL